MVGATSRSTRERTATISDLPEPLQREEASRPHHQHRDEDDQGPNGFQVRAKITTDVAEGESHQKPTDDRARGAIESPDDSPGETEDQNVVHERGIEQQRGRNQYAGERPDQ